MAKDLTRTSTRRRLRNEATFTERLVWNFLKDAQLDGRKFTRQKGIGHFIADFYCPEEKLAIELDGSSHDSNEAKQRDADRDDYFRSLGIQVMRFTNDEFLADCDSVIRRIRETWKGRERNVVPPSHGRPRTTRAGEPRPPTR